MDDRLLQQEISAELEFEPSVDAARIGVSVTDRVVTLSGLVPNFAQKRAAEAAAQRVKGVRAVAERIKVDLGGVDPPADEDIARRVLTALDDDVLVPRGKVTVSVQQGRATLDGEVEWNFQRTSAEEDVRKLRGIVGILNYITLKPRVDAGDVTRGIADALQRSAGVEARRINITAQDGKVRIEGSVNTWSEREVIEHAVWSAPGVTAVEDRLHVLVT